MLPELCYYISVDRERYCEILSDSPVLKLLNYSFVSFIRSHLRFECIPKITMINNYCDLVRNIKNVFLFLFCSPDSTTITPLAFLFFLHCPTTIPPFYLSGSTTHRHPSDYRQSVLLGLLSHDCNHLTFYDHT